MIKRASPIWYYRNWINVSDEKRKGKASGSFTMFFTTFRAASTQRCLIWDLKSIVLQLSPHFFHLTSSPYNIYVDTTLVFAMLPKTSVIQILGRDVNR